jgi:hypothetical protein
MKKILNWFIYSSENPQEFSLTLKGIVASILPIALLLGQQLGFSLDTVNAEQFVLSLVTVFTTAITLVGAIRKIVNTINGTKTVAFQVDVEKKLSPVAKKKVAKKVKK